MPFVTSRKDEGGGMNLKTRIWFIPHPSSLIPHPSGVSPMNPAYALKDTSSVLSPALLFYKDLIRRNIARAVEIAGNPARLRPHVKTHKTREIVRLEQEAGI